MHKAEIKKKLIEEVKEELKRKAVFLKEMIDDAQEEANFHKGAMSSRYDTFKEEAQAKRDSYAKQLQGVITTMTLVSKIPSKLCVKGEFGSVIETDKKSFFLFANVMDEPILINGKSYYPISPISPLGKAIISRSAGETVSFNQVHYLIIDVF
ncbi:MAG: GreA/GreB family elongation factor [Melioribacteraceae bacterium]|nr:GreA/GreB family elongation factor [Melioribacteraceae bacterium]